MRFLFACLLIALSFPLAAAMPDPGPAAWWTFDGGGPDTATDAIAGYFRYVDGVRGKALRFDGSTTAVIRKHAEAPYFTSGFTIEAWMAPQEYSWHWTAIVNQEQDHKSGYFFGIDYMGRIGFQVAIDGRWQSLVSRDPVPLLKWSHVAATFSPEAGLALYIGGKPAGTLPVKGKFTLAAVDLVLGMSQARMAPYLTEREPTRRALANSKMAFDGLIDEVKIYSRALSAEEIVRAFAAAEPLQSQPLSYRVMPSGPKGKLRFGAYHANLKYAEEWDRRWRSTSPDLVVGFDMAPIRLVCWRGISYYPCWVTDHGDWFSNESVERAIPNLTVEPMNDKQARYSHAKIIESNDARVVVFWRYAPVTIFYEIPYADPDSGWGEWAEEYYTVYPDGVAARKVTAFTGNMRKGIRNMGSAYLEWSQSLPLLHPGQRPDDLLDGNQYVTFADMAGRSHTFHWPPVPEDQQPGLSDANIQVIHYKNSQFKPFLVLTTNHPRIWLPKYQPRRPGEQRDGMSMSTSSVFWWWNHWPVAQLANDGRVALTPDRPGHSFVSTQDSYPYQATGNTETQIQLCGLTDKTAGELVPLAKSWMHPPKLELSSREFESHGYDPTQRAYLLAAKGTHSATPLEITLLADQDSPVHNPAFVIRGWGDSPVALKIGGQETGAGLNVRYGYRRQLEGTDLILWLRTESIRPLTLSLVPTRAAPPRSK